MADPIQYLPDGLPGRCWRRSDRRVFETAPKRVRELVALQVVSGQMRYLIDDRILTLGPGTLLWAHSDQAHLLLSETTDFDMWVFVIAPALLKPRRLYPPALATSVDGAGARLLPADVVRELAKIAGPLRETQDQDVLAAGLRWWALRAWAAWKASDTMTGERAHPAVGRTAELLRSDPNMPLQALAQRAGLSLSRLGRVFKDETGRSLTRFRSEQRLALVDAMIASGRAPSLLVAALDAGFGSYAQFYRVFRTIRGASPRAVYRAGAEPSAR